MAEFFTVFVIGTIIPLQGVNSFLRSSSFILFIHIDCLLRLLHDLVHYQTVDTNFKALACEDGIHESIEVLWAVLAELYDQDAAIIRSRRLLSTSSMLVF